MNDITKAKIVDGVWLEVEYTTHTQDADGENHSADLKGLFKSCIHDDLKHAFDKLRIHLAFLSEYSPEELYTEDQFENGDIYSFPHFETFRVNGFSLGGSDEHSGVTLIGRKNLKTKKVLNLNSPFTKFEYQEGQDNYKFQYRLYLDIQKALDEVEAYLNGKCAPNAQLEIELN